MPQALPPLGQRACKVGLTMTTAVFDGYDW